MNNCAIIAMYHKGGSTWMSQTFQEVCRRRNIQFSNLELDESVTPDNCKPPIVITLPHAWIEKYEWILNVKPHSILHLVRDPRDVIISGMHYHCKSREEWLHIRRDKFGGMTYQERLNSFATEKERYLCEIKYSNSPVRMAAWKYGRPHCFECKYEDLIHDTDMSLFTKIAVHLGFEPDELDDCRKAFWRYAIFGGKASRVGNELHIRSGRARQWEMVFDQELAAAFRERFGDLLITLGYESDNSWIERLPARRPELEGRHPDPESSGVQEHASQ